MNIKRTFLLFIAVTIGGLNTHCTAREVIDLNGVWEFEQSLKAFVPKEFTREIPVPGLIHLAHPRIEQYETLFVRPDSVEYGEQHDLAKYDYQPRYNWYRKAVEVPKEMAGREAVLTIGKSKYVTQAFVNGIDVGTSMACYTPIDFRVTDALVCGEENEILIRVGDRKWLPSEAAGSTDKEKVNYIPGIWDDVELSFTGAVRAERVLFLPDLTGKKVTAKVRLRNFHPAQTVYGGKMEDVCKVSFNIREKNNPGKIIAKRTLDAATKRDNRTAAICEITIDNPHAWSPEEPFLYEGEVVVECEGKLSDKVSKRFGMRDFNREGKHFTLNGKKRILRGTNITLHRFFEDPDCQALPWDREWVKKLLIDIPKQVHWDTMRICVGIAPDMWYEIADEYGLMLQNEWLYWQNHGWDEQIRKEYSDWVWSDGSHPSIIIWDAINENWDEYVGNTLIPELKELDPTRIWDAGYMTGEHMTLDEMDEPHPYRVFGMSSTIGEELDRNPYPLGDLHDWPGYHSRHLNASAAQLVNEYGWMWLWRDGRPAKLMQYSLPYYLGEESTSEERRFFQAYWEQLQTEWLRTERSFAGVLAFCYLTNNYGYTGDWFYGDIAKLEAGLTLDWFRHCFSPQAVFIDLVDGRYMKHVKPYEPGSMLAVNLVGVNDLGVKAKGKAAVKLLDSKGKVVHTEELEFAIPEYYKQYKQCVIPLPDKSGGYLLLAEFYPEKGKANEPVISRRYIKVGEPKEWSFYDLKPKRLE